MLDINTHEFTLAAIRALHDSDAKILRKIARLRFVHNLKFAMVIVVGYIAYDNLKYEIKEVKRLIAKEANNK